MVNFEAYFDESGTHRNAHALCLAGYLINRAAVVPLTRKWNRVLKRYGLPYFHMAECAHRTGVFAHLDRDQCAAVEIDVIKLIGTYASYSVAVTVNQSDFDDIFIKHNSIGKPYTFLANAALAIIRNWVLDNPRASEIDYYFESGHEHQYEASAMMNLIFLNNELRVGCRYNSHAHRQKGDSPMLQAADLLAWHVYTDYRRRREGLDWRKDYAALMKVPGLIFDMTPQRLQYMTEMLRPIHDWNVPSVTLPAAWNEWIAKHR